MRDFFVLLMSSPVHVALIALGCLLTPSLFYKRYLGMEPRAETRKATGATGLVFLVAGLVGGWIESRPGGDGLEPVPPKAVVSGLEFTHRVASGCQLQGHPGNYGINLRREPVVKDGNIISWLENGTQLVRFHDVGKWYQVALLADGRPTSGYIAQECASVPTVEPVGSSIGAAASG